VDRSCANGTALQIVDTAGRDVLIGPPEADRQGP
jgi:hypothetical protein